ncbi:hypothetical protein HanXRQr2_Chr07g0303191 [Helianthus annuus]|uniref:Uncharacterized protein n=1 Tax=Helianthus annuus TaxID=4232 RepID=A0A9K3IMJ9_HELAN|nr:hypothetical protein HanXRQr2_Chr07g0303191 [Helianthus annuus]KAJ0905392.1 hypothetical protein HanPSC8_Chr07g0293461 [Helianthus annuus]
MKRGQKLPSSDKLSRGRCFSIHNRFRLRTRFETISLWIWKLCNLSKRGSPLTVYLSLGQEEVP